MVAAVLGFATRLALFLLCVLFSYSVLDYDSCLSLPGSHASLFTPLGRMLSSVCKWDSLFFLQIAHEGYTYEKNHAFFPLYPLLIRSVAILLTPIVDLGYVTKEESFLIAGITISWVSFAVSAVVIERLSLTLLGDRKKAEWTRNFFLMTPAGVFMTAIYSESLFTALSCIGLWWLYRRPRKSEEQLWTWERLASACFFALATATRSNGSLLLIFQIHISASIVLRNWSKLPSQACLFVILAGIHLSPIVLYLRYAASIYCNGTEQSPYCSSLIPNVYSYVQAQYWNVGWFTYWEWKQVPNFILAGPILFLSITAITRYIRADPRRFLTLGLVHREKEGRTFQDNDAVLPFVYYWLVYVFVLVAIANVQIATRQLASLPALYWFSSEYSKERPIIVLFFISYNFIGAILFSNFYPWT